LRSLMPDVRCELLSPQAPGFRRLRVARASRGSACRLHLGPMGASRGVRVALETWRIAQKLCAHAERWIRLKADLRKTINIVRCYLRGLGFTESGGEGCVDLSGENLWRLWRYLGSAMVVLIGPAQCRTHRRRDRSTSTGDYFRVPPTGCRSFPYPYDQTRGSVTDAEISAEREMCQWFNAQYDTLMTQIDRFQRDCGRR